MVEAGSGANSAIYGSTNGFGGNGGGLEGGNGRYITIYNIFATGGTQTAPGDGKSYPSLTGAFGKGGEGTNAISDPGKHCGGGAGLYGGGGEYIAGRWWFWICKYSISKEFYNYNV